MKTDNKLKKLEEQLGHAFNDISLLTEALTHSSYANELMQKNVPTRSNERLEVLGDAVLEIVASTYLFENFPDFPEGSHHPR